MGRPGKQAVTINLDETSICSCLKTHGCYATHNQFGEATKKPTRFYATNSLSRRRSYMSYCALICSAKEYQHMLPQLLLVNNKAAPAKDLEDIKK